MDLHEKISDMIVQATQERSHYYVKSLFVEVKDALTELQAENERLKEVLREFDLHAGHRVGSRIQKLVSEALNGK